MNHICLVCEINNFTGTTYKLGIKETKKTTIAMYKLNYKIKQKIKLFVRTRRYGFRHRLCKINVSNELHSGPMQL